MKESILEISNSMYDNYGQDTAINYFKNFSLQLSCFDPKDVLIYQIKNFPRSYALEFFMASPFLWRDFKSNDWLELMRKNSPRENAKRQIDQTASFVDIEVIERFLNLNGLEVYLNDPYVSDQDKENAKIYFSIFNFASQKDEFDVERLDGEYFIQAEELLPIMHGLLDLFKCKSGLVHQHHQLR